MSPGGANSNVKALPTGPAIQFPAAVNSTPFQKAQKRRFYGAYSKDNKH